MLLTKEQKMSKDRAQRIRQVVSSKFDRELQFTIPVERASDHTALHNNNNHNYSFNTTTNNNNKCVPFITVVIAHQTFFGSAKIKKTAEEAPSRLVTTHYS